MIFIRIEQFGFDLFQTRQLQRCPSVVRELIEDKREVAWE